MCGIAGVVNFGEDGRSRLERMLSLLAHRGPDDAGVISDGQVVLGHRRLTVIDLSANGHQPMPNEDDSIWITYNGELYGTDPLRAWLEARGHRFRSRTDTEALVHLYEEEGAALFPRINGMFAFAIHDRRRRKLLLARDRLGVKPLFYTFRNGGMAFASELNGLAAALDSRPSLRAESLGQYLLQGYACAPDTIYEGVYSLPPGHYLDVDLASLEAGPRPEPREYWDAPFTGDDRRPYEPLAAECEALLADAVRIRMVADVPLGAFLSGGIDSGSVVALMARASADPVQTFTVDVVGTDRSEGEQARAVAAMHRANHREIAIEAAGADEYWARLAHFGAPFNCASLLNAWLVSRAARRYVTVALSGDGGDELFGGYSRYLQMARRRRPRFHQVLHGLAGVIDADFRGRARLADAGDDDFTYYIGRRNAMPVTLAERAVGVSMQAWVDRMRAIWERYPADAATRAMYYDLKTYLADHILAKVDNASMEVSLEVRTPFLDYRVVEFAGRVPSGLKLRGGTTKWFLREVARPWLPPGLADQQKMGFDPPIASWIFDAAIEDRLAELSSGAAAFRRVLDGNVVDRWSSDARHQSRWRVPRRAVLWSVYQLERWLQGGAAA